MYEVLKGCAELLVLMDPKVLLVKKAIEARKARLGFKVLLVNETSVDSVVNEAKRAYKVMLQMFLSVLATHLPTQLAERYGEIMCFVKYHVSEDEASVVIMTGGVQTRRNVSAHKEPTWHFDAQFIDKQGHA